MFTGIVEEIGRVGQIKKTGKSIEIVITCERVLSDVKIGDSISSDGVCLTVTSFDQTSFKADLMPETVDKSAFKSKKFGDKVNLERAMALGDRFGGHMVSGHIDGVGRITYIKKDDIAYRYGITCDKGLLKYMIDKGSITIDGISLTITKVLSDHFEVSIIPQTQEDTTLSEKKVGSLVNLENDLIGKYVERLMNFDKTKGINKSFLEEHGFM